MTIQERGLIDEAVPACRAGYEEIGVLRNQVIAEPGAVDLLLQLLEEPDWRHGERWTSTDDR